MKDMMMKMDAAIVQGEPALVQASMSQVEMTVWPVSYTHLDVYKRQVLIRCIAGC